MLTVQEAMTTRMCKNVPLHEWFKRLSMVKQIRVKSDPETMHQFPANALLKVPCPTAYYAQIIKTSHIAQNTWKEIGTCLHMHLNGLASHMSWSRPKSAGLYKNVS